MHSIANGTLNRLSGFVMVVNTLLPALVLLVISVGSAYLVPDYLQSIRKAANGMYTAANQAKDAAGKAAANIQKHLKSAEDRAIGITKGVKDAEKHIKNGVAKIPGKRVRQGLRAAMKEVFKPLAPLGGLALDFSSIGVEIGKMKKLKTYFATFAVNAQKISTSLRGLADFFAKWAALLWTTLIVIVGWVGLSYVLWAHRRLVTGLAMMRGHLKDEG
jgi:hypothetical protein